MKKLLLLLILSFFSTQGLSASCPDGSEPTKTVSADGSYFEYKCPVPDGKAVSYNDNHELPSRVIPNDATISLYEDRKMSFLKNRRNQGRIYSIKPKGNAVQFVNEVNLPSSNLEHQLSEGFLLSYLFYDDGVIKYNGKAADGRFNRDITDETVFFTHSTGKSITSYIVGHAICEGYISSIDEVIDWPLMKNTLYQGQPLRNLLNFTAGDRHTVDAKKRHYIMGSSTHHRSMGLDTIAKLLDGTEAKGDEVFYNNVLSDIIANYIIFKAGENYDDLMRNVFQDKVKIEHEVTYEKHKKFRQYFASYSYQMTRLDFLRVAEAMMRDYQDKTCVGKYLIDSQKQAAQWNKYRPYTDDANLWLHNYAKKYGAQFYFDFHGMDGRNIMATDGYLGQNMLIDLDNSRIVITNSAAPAWDVETYMLNVIKDGKLPNDAIVVLIFSSVAIPKKHDLLTSIEVSDAFDGSYSFKISNSYGGGISSKRLGNGYIEINNGIMTVAKEGRTLRTGSEDLYDSFEGRIDKKGNITSMLKIAPQCGNFDLQDLEFIGNIDSQLKYICGEYLDVDFEVILKLGEKE